MLKTDLNTNTFNENGDLIFQVETFNPNVKE